MRALRAGCLFVLVAARAYGDRENDVDPLPPRHLLQRRGEECGEGLCGGARRGQKEKKKKQSERRGAERRESGGQRRVSQLCRGG